VAIPWHLVAELPSPAALEYVLVEPLNVAMDLVDLAAPESGQRVMVVGGGPIGLLVLHLLRKAGLEAVLFVKHAWQARRRLAEEMGAEVKQAEELARPTGDGYDVAIVSAPYEYIPQAAAWVNFGGAVVYNGFSATPSVTLDLEDLHTRRVSLLPSFPHPQGSFERAIVHVTAERCALRRLISHRVPLHQAERVFELFSGSPEETIKVVLLGPAHVDD
jgi:L-iditol 2-dehydrogenase